MNEAEAHHLDRRRVRDSFERAAAEYDQSAVLQHEIGTRLLERLDYVRIAPQRVLDAGTGTGRALAPLARRYPQARVVALDLAHSMLRTARQGARAWWHLRDAHDYICGDVEQLPLANASVDLIYSNLVLQWCNDLDRVLAQTHRVLRPQGLLMFTTFGPDTLKELRASFRAVDNYTHVNTFIDMHDIGDALLRAGYADPVMDVERLTLTYPDVRSLMRDLKRIGAHNATHARPRGLFGRQQWAQLEAAYQHYRSADGRIPASYEVVYGHAWRLEDRPTRAPDPTQGIRVPLTRVGGRRGGQPAEKITHSGLR